MKPPDPEVVRKIVGERVRKADQDIRSAEILVSQDPPLLYPSCFHAQQAAEKYLKAYLTRHQVEFPKTHSIRELLNSVGTVDENLATNLVPAAALTPYGVEVRVPGDAPEPKEQETDEAITLAKSVRDAVSDQLAGVESRVEREGRRTPRLPDDSGDN